MSSNEYRSKNLKRTAESGIAEKLQKTSLFANYFAKRHQQFSCRPTVRLLAIYRPITLSLVTKFTETIRSRSSVAMSSSAESAISAILFQQNVVVCDTNIGQHMLADMSWSCVHGCGMSNLEEQCISGME